MDSDDDDFFADLDPVDETSATSDYSAPRARYERDLSPPPDILLEELLGEEEALSHGDESKEFCLANSTPPTSHKNKSPKERGPDSKAVAGSSSVFSRASDANSSRVNRSADASLQLPTSIPSRLRQGEDEVKTSKNAKTLSTTGWLSAKDGHKNKSPKKRGPNSKLAVGSSSSAFSSYERDLSPPPDMLLEELLSEEEALSHGDEGNEFGLTNFTPPTSHKNKSPKRRGPDGPDSKAAAGSSSSVFSSASDEAKTSKNGKTLLTTGWLSAKDGHKIKSPKKRGPDPKAAAGTSKYSSIFSTAANSNALRVNRSADASLQLPTSIQSRLRLVEAEAKTLKNAETSSTMELSAKDSDLLKNSLISYLWTKLKVYESSPSPIAKEHFHALDHVIAWTKDRLGSHIPNDAKICRIPENLKRVQTARKLPDSVAGTKSVSSIFSASVPSPSASVISLSDSAESLSKPPSHGWTLSPFKETTNRGSSLITPGNDWSQPATPGNPWSQPSLGPQNVTNFTSNPEQPDKEGNEGYFLENAQNDGLDPALLRRDYDFSETVFKTLRAREAIQ